MRRLSKTAMAFVPFFSLSVAGWFGFLLGHRGAIDRDGRATTVSRLSPDETILARLIEVSVTQSPGRRFKVQLQFLRQSETRNIFLSPEEEGAGQPGSERLIWSKDGTKLLIVGRHFFVKEDLFLDNGDQLFFLYDVPNGRGWCNSEAPVPFPQLTAGTIAGFEFTEPVVLKRKM